MSPYHHVFGYKHGNQDSETKNCHNYGRDNEISRRELGDDRDLSVLARSRLAPGQQGDVVGVAQHVLCLACTRVTISHTNTTPAYYDNAVQYINTYMQHT